ncbi:MAG: hypothetical protein KIG95_09085 [Comamonas sp.]|nr:hypothetical protein [Comamonas sp.]
MKNTYFIRHSSALDVDEDTLDRLWKEDRIAIHYPQDTNGDFSRGDSRSLNPSDYIGHARSALKRLHELARDGGYVFATYRGKTGGKVGYVSPGSSVELFRGSWGGKNKLQGREAMLKALQVRQSRNLTAEEAIFLTAVQPRQGTFCRWRKVGQRVIALVTGTPPAGLDSLTPDLQEVMCMEYLRTENARIRGLPVLRHTLMPVGRTMKDIDILGVSENGKIISAQVTFKRLSVGDSKLRKLDPYRLQGGATIYFCRCDQAQEINGHIVFPLQHVFDDFCMNNDSGQEWFRLATGTYREV